MSRRKSAATVRKEFKRMYAGELSDLTAEEGSFLFGFEFGIKWLLGFTSHGAIDFLKYTRQSTEFPYGHPLHDSPKDFLLKSAIARAATPLMVMTVAIMAVGIFLPMGPIAHYFKLQALPLSYFPILAVILLGYMTLTQLMKGFYARRFGWQ